MSLLLGPILQFRGIDQGQVRLSALVVTGLDDRRPEAALGAGLAAVAPPTMIGAMPFGNPDRCAWRFDLQVPLGAGRVDYVIAGVPGQFAVPAAGESPRMAYASCNGFSDPKLMKGVDQPNDRWLHLAGQHKKQPYHLLLLGGDQVYSDEMWARVTELRDWRELSRGKRTKAAFNQTMRAQVDRFFADLYVQRWSQPEPAAMLGAIPTIMMWDDHDIMDGWGSYPKDLHGCAVFQGIFETARAYFQVFQLQCAAGEVHPNTIPGQPAFHLGFTGLGGLTLLVPDLRSERMPADADRPEQIVAPASWNAIYDWLERATAAHQHLLFVSSIPVAYLDLGQIERLLNFLPGQQELEDDLRDHWRSEPHRQERLRLVHRLLDHAADKSCRVTILSGDVHVAALSVIESDRGGHVGNAAVINQLVSTGIVHPAPPAIARYVLESVADRVDPVDRGITATMQPIAERGRYLIGARNWLALEPDDQHRLWANWHVEGMTSPLTKVIHAVA